MSDSAGVILFFGDLILLSKRAVAHKGIPVSFGGYWSPFTGAIEEGESPLCCAVRELREESGLEIDSWDLKYITGISRENSSLVLYGYELDHYFIPSLDFEHTEYGYFKISDLKTSPIPLDKEIFKAILHYTTVLRA